MDSVMAVDIASARASKASPSASRRRAGDPRACTSAVVDGSAGEPSRASSATAMGSSATPVQGSIRLPEAVCVPSLFSANSSRRSGDGLPGNVARDGDVVGDSGRTARQSVAPRQEETFPKPSTMLRPASAWHSSCSSPILSRKRRKSMVTARANDNCSEDNCSKELGGRACSSIDSRVFKATCAENVSSNLEPWALTWSVNIRDQPSISWRRASMRSVSACCCESCASTAASLTNQSAPLPPAPPTPNASAAIRPARVGPPATRRC
mmetsp:Transcript_30668/g.88522  ORF Transcript_30668/g.88522 Transcript_30668/m.88522 type:complete len:267 (+) Transcript_30668:629-1429(+)